MARKIIWTLEAADDLESIATYIARDSHFLQNLSSVKS